MKDMNTLELPGQGSWHTDLSIGDVVLFYFPHAERDTCEAPKSRTCLVVDLFDEAGTTMVELAYGTSVDTAANRGREIHLVDPEEIAIAGLHRPSRFVCARRVIVSIDHPGWDLDDWHATPVLGRLGPRVCAELDKIRAAIQADQAALFNVWKEPKPFAVERRFVRPDPHVRQPKSQGVTRHV